MRHLIPWLPWIGGALVLLIGVIAAMRAARKRAALVGEVSVMRQMGPGDGDPLQIKKYRVQRKLGAGGMAKVYLAVAPDGRKVALKIPDPQFFQTEEHRNYFRQELSVSKKMQHPNVVRILDYSDGSGDELPYIAMEFVDGVTLDRRIPRRQPVNVEFAAKILYAVTSALEYAHNMGVVHRDIKPENIMLSNQGEVKVADFGIARDLWDPPRNAADANSFVGSPHYMSPEQINSEHVDYRTDYYALGVVGFRLLTGYLPFEGENTLEVITRKVSQLPPPPSTYNPNIPLEIESLIRDLMQREPERRPVAAVGIRKTLRKYLAPPKKKRGPARRPAPDGADF
jgi:serine/threonine-protein kinase